MGNSTWSSAVAALGACCSVGLTLWVGRNAPRALLVMFLMWVVSPFAALLAAGGSSRPWAVRAGATLRALALLITLTSLAVYTIAAMRWTRPTPAFLMVPLASWLLIAAGVGSAAWSTRKG